MDKYDQKTLEKSETGIPGYKMLAGRFASRQTHTQYTVKRIDDEWAKILATEANLTDKDITVIEFPDVIRISYPKKHVHTLSHITAYMLANMRIAVCQQLQNINRHEVIRIATDAIYLCADPDVENMAGPFDPEKLVKPFRIKPVEIATSKTKVTTDYLACMGNASELPEVKPAFRQTYGNEIHVGPGGAGKTHYQLTDAGAVRPIYIAPSYKLARAKYIEFGGKIMVTVLRRLLSGDQNLKRAVRYRNVLIFDEASMIDEKTRDMIDERFPNHRKVWLGDLGYQAPPFEQGSVEMTCSGFDHVENWDGRHIYRYKCDELRDLAALMREWIKSGDVTDNQAWAYVKRKLRNISEQQLKVEYKPDTDVILARSHESCDAYTHMFKHLDKFKILEDRRPGSREFEETASKLSILAAELVERGASAEEIEKANKEAAEAEELVYGRGEVVTKTPPEGVKYERRHGFTVHSVQGCTFEGTIYLDSNWSSAKDQKGVLRVLYTAISRARTISQIVVVTKNASTVAPASAARIKKTGAFTNKVYVNKQRIVDLLQGNNGAPALRHTTDDPTKVSEKYILERFLQNYDDAEGCVVLKYRRKDNVGRFYGAQGVATKATRRVVRKYLYNGSYTCLDMTNCHVVLCLQLCENLRRKGTVVNTTQLERVRTDRDSLLADIVMAYNVDRDAAKELIIRTLFGGGHAQWEKDHNCHGTPPSWLPQLRKELDDIAIDVFDDNCHLLQQKHMKGGLNGGVALIFQTIEANIITEVMEDLQVPVDEEYDGVNIRNEDVQRLGGEAAVLERVEAVTRRMGYDLMRWACKPM
jgi:polyhydroxyalkanoate synthesis regulator phasin